MLYATISADIVDSTKMTAEDTIRVSKLLTDFLEPMMKVSEGSWGRVVMIVLIVMSQYEAIGFLIAAKSILRFSSVNESEKSEYVVAGTFISFCIALALGLLVVKL